MIRDSNLSWEATGLLIYLLHLPDNFEITLPNLNKLKNSTPEITERTFHELENAKYIQVRQEEYFVYDEIQRVCR